MAIKASPVDGGDSQMQPLSYWHAINRNAASVISRQAINQSRPGNWHRYMSRLGDRHSTISLASAFDAGKQHLLLKWERSHATPHDIIHEVASPSRLYPSGCRKVPDTSLASRSAPLITPPSWESDKSRDPPWCNNHEVVSSSKRNPHGWCPWAVAPVAHVNIHMCPEMGSVFNAVYFCKIITKEKENKYTML